MHEANIRVTGAFAFIAAVLAPVVAPSAVHAQHSAFVLDAVSADLGPTDFEAAVFSPLEHAFAQAQLRNPRVLRARLEARFNIKRMFHAAGVTYPAAEIFLRAFKRDRILELWARPAGGDTFSLLKVYDICAISGELGPKRRQGDAQVPEGFYQIDLFNPVSEYNLSLHVNYPNAVDRARPDRGHNLGGDIYVHGGCESIGCLAMTDEGIRELYWIAVEARAAGQTRIPIHIFPTRLDADGFARLEKSYDGQQALVRFWSDLRAGYDYFEQHRRLPQVTAGVDGRYHLAGLGSTPAAAARGGTSQEAR